VSGGGICPGTIRVLIVDDHEMVRRGLATFLDVAGDVSVVGVADTAAEAVLRARQLRPDVVLMDQMLGDDDGVATIRATREASPESQIIALTSFQEEERVVRAVEAGAMSYLLKDIGADGLVDAIRAARAGLSTLAPSAAQVVFKSACASGGTSLGKDLTDRQREVLRLLIRGFSNRQIATHLAVAPSTANLHVSGVLAKLGVQSRTEAVAVALRKRLVA
jgi:NarL family two-component system response regulator LiaR